MPGQAAVRAEAPAAGGGAGRGRAWGEPLLAALVALVGIALTVWGALSHGGPMVAPGSALILIGGGWLGNALARNDVLIVPAGLRNPRSKVS
jgi:hypothetical protein